ncbi:MAG: tyrosine-type recombinase/integrase, partial [Thermaurantiacus tibetensis]
MVGEERLAGKLTAKQVAGLTAPGRYTDGDGLMLVVDRAGRRYWRLRYRIDGRRRDLSFGPERLVSLREAREAAAAARQQIRAGVDPLASRKAAAVAGITFAEAARKVHAEHRTGWRNGKHCDQWLRTLELHAFPALGDIPVGKVNRADVVRALEPVWLAHP